MPRGTTLYHELAPNRPLRRRTTWRGRFVTEQSDPGERARGRFSLILCTNLHIDYGTLARDGVVSPVWWAGRILHKLIVRGTEKDIASPYTGTLQVDRIFSSTLTNPYFLDTIRLKQAHSGDVEKEGREI